MNKKDNYELILLQLASLLEDERDFIANLSNTSAFLNEVLENINWVGFYIIKNNQLVLGPFQGKVACVRIAIGSGVCGSAVASKTTQLIKDVHTFPGHIACDSDSNSEIVIPIFKNNNVIAVLDIDSPIFNRFDEIDKYYLEKVVKIIEKNTDIGEK